MLEIIRQKLMSRKFLIAAVTVIAGIAGMCGADDSIVETISGALMALVPCIIYIATEGKIDAAAIGQIAGAVEDIAESIDNKDSDDTTKEDK